MPLRIFYRVLWLVLCGNAVAVYFASHSIRTVVVTTLACWLLLQVCYFGSVLFLIWRSGFAREAGQRAEHFGSCKDVGTQPPDHEEATSESADLLQNQMLAISLLLP
ncbi:exopolysaccharide production repressor protein [Mesorhizobium amorphae]|uniref:Exopolysaccharide repressor protein n=1 Tax=Mesorhizobium amorphae CCNWGS0123 TaxID=1082933 RepID=G6Y2M1_9HYPH|nr:exopolysaccharide production repressor protein [Mesorhizobium amorphae]ANT54611.1 exopolysaccharide repressor protein [Mesorhizobium amorphae CCNWGS0123]EHH13982.1 exopolysaccharide repressor protein [Mesorhizobium amorphae CCNWGS0123]